jgi:hypothetical protein
MGKKITKTFTIDSDTYLLFDEICKSDDINRSKLIEGFIKDFVKYRPSEMTKDSILSKINKFGINSISNKELNFLKNNHD